MNSRQYLRKVLRASFKVFISFENLMLMRWKENRKDCSLREFKITMLEMKIAILELKSLVENINANYIETEIECWKLWYGDPMLNYWDD
jgi:hypothetical protein